MRRKIQRQSNTNYILIALASFFGILLVLYIVVALYFTGHFLFNTYVNGNPAYNMTAKEVQEQVVSGLRSYVLKVNSRGNISDTITSDDISLSLHIDGEFDRALKKQNPFLWPAYLFKETHIETEHIVEYSHDVLISKIDSLKLFLPENIIEPTDAHVSEESGDDGFYIVPEDGGQSPIRDEVVTRITAAVDVLEPEVTLDDQCYKSAAILSDNKELEELRDSLNTFCRADITYEFGSEKVIVNGTVIKEWCDINGTNVRLDEEKVRAFVNSMASKYDTFGRKRTIISHSGESVTVAGGDYGWWMDRATETKELIEAIKRGDKGVRTPVYFGTAKAYGEKDFGDSYVEIDLTNQHLWVYQNGSVVLESDFVSGCVNKRRSTPTGTYGITYKERDATLVGENYSSSVKYWMPFNGNVGMHDASWRSEFGGSIYVSNGSHGCINLPTEKAAKIYDIVEKGEAVLVYGGKTLPEPVKTTEAVDPAEGEAEVTGQTAAETTEQTNTAAQTQQEAAPAETAQPVQEPVAEQPAPVEEPQEEASSDGGEEESSSDESED